MGKPKGKPRGAGVTRRHKTRGGGGFGTVSRSPKVAEPHKHKKNKISRGKMNKRLRKPKRNSKRIRK